MGSGIVMLELLKVGMLLEQRNDVRGKRLLIGCCIDVSLKEVKRRPVVLAEGRPHHDAAPSPKVGLQNTTVSVSLTVTSVYTCSPVCM